MEVPMSLTRKRKKELNRLRSSAEDLWGQQQVLLDQANAVAREASRQAGFLAKEHVVPRMQEGFDSYVRPVSGATGKLAGNAKDRFVTDVIPAVGSAIGTAMTVVDHARDARARNLVAAKKTYKKSAAAVSSDDGGGAGRYVAIAIALIAAVGVLYAVWQTFRADDELWVADEEPIADATE
jgi:hypothetical protein